MFVARRDLAFAKGRFALIATVVAMITVLVGFLTGLTGGLAGQNVDAVLSWNADRVVLSAPSGSAQPAFSTSNLTQKQVDAWKATPGVDSIDAIGLTQIGASHGNTTAGIALISGAPGAGTGPGAPDDAAAPLAGQVILSEDAAKGLGAAAGDTISVAGQELRVEAVTGTGHYSHVPLASVAPSTWKTVAQRTGVADDVVASVLSVHGKVSGDAVSASDDAAATTTLSGLGALTAVGSFRSEIGSLGLMIGLLLGISALVVGAFFTVWTLQRKGDVAILKALGTPTSALRRDALGQAGIVLILGIGVGLAIVVGVGTLISGSLPFILSPLTTLGPGLIMAVLGLAGAAVALRSVTQADPLTALGSNR